jgi:hypothetical protein
VDFFPIEILGSIYESSLGKSARAHGGVYYTPRYIVDFIVEESLGRQLDEIVDVKTFATFEKRTRNLRIVDPACGSGIFLLRVFERMCEHWRLRFTRYPNDRQQEHCWVDSATGNVQLTVELKRRILLDNIYGVDKDAHAVEITRLSLYLKMLEGENKDVLLPPPLEKNIQCGNSLIASDFSHDAEELAQVGAFDWSTAFAEIMQLGGFDVVVGNPPWGSELDAGQLEYLRQKNQAIIVRMIDAYMYFVNASLNLLRPSGRMGMILPDVFLYQSDTEKLRRKLALETSIECVANLGDVFEQVVRPACVVVCTKSPPVNQIVNIVDLVSEDERTKISHLFDQSGFQKILQSHFLGAPRCLFITRDVPRFDLWNRLQRTASVPLSEMVDEDGIQRGVSPDLKEAFLVDTPTMKKWKLEKTHLRPTLTGGVHVKRYHIERPDLQVIYTARGDDFSKLAGIRSYIDQFNKQITCTEVKQNKHSLYALHRARNERIFDKPEKLVGVITEDEIVLALDDQRSYPTDGIYLFAPKASVDARYLMGILNSRLFVYIYRLLSMEEGRALAQVKPTLLAQLPIRKVDPNNRTEKRMHDELVALVDKMLMLAPKSGAETQATNQKIDELVYQLYGLTAEDRKLLNPHSSQTTDA